jgi:hypothetical protein
MDMKWVAAGAMVSVFIGCSHPKAPPPPAATSSIETPKQVATAPPVVVTEPEPAYDLAADLASREKTIRTDVSAKTRFEVVEGVFQIASPSGATGSAAVVTRAALDAYYNHRFDKRPKQAITVLLFDAAPPYNAFCKTHWGKACTTPFGFYEPSIRTVVMNVAPGIGTLTHELVHPIVEADFPDAPTWINEGIASLYEAFSLPKKGEIRGNKNFRHPGLVSALSSKSERPHASLPALFAMSDAEFRGSREGLNYATARYFCMWMETQKKLWSFYRAWRDDFAHDPTGEKAFRAAMGKTPAELDEAWASWVKSL